MSNVTGAKKEGQTRRYIRLGGACATPAWDTRGQQVTAQDTTEESQNFLSELYNDVWGGILM